MSKSLGHDILERTAQEICALHDLKKKNSLIFVDIMKNAFYEIRKYV